MRHNGVRTAVLLGVLSGLMLAVGAWIGGGTGVLIALLIALGAGGVAFFCSDRIALAALRARPVGEVEQPELYGIVRELSYDARRPMPRLYLSPTNQPNAFATGRNPRNAAICVTRGLITLLDERELRGVIAHELSHVYNRDILLNSVAGALATMITYFGYIGVLFGSTDDGDEPPGLLGTLILLTLGPVAATMIRLAVARSREFAADEAAARLTGDPGSLASALRKIDAGTRHLPLPRNAQIASAGHMMIASPFGAGSCFATHPPTTERVARLERMAGRPA
ncbi:protease HtpX [Acrocarpospora pleiomorpha]|uniref:Protease HtpX homolog n=1 Tax=Acrocarpospora pleiomorpha TaxID=90975 RepID=A0A5M3XY76_9ACTN|nr:M48 family metalloprotease [Acrocarpospora pleiomorpha]GES25846.1 protease HtpX [Acrocarpospora pleiomorpha]